MITKDEEEVEEIKIETKKKVEIKPDPRLIDIVTKPKPVVKKVSKVDLKETIEKLNRLDSLIFKSSGSGRWGEVHKILSSIKKDIESKLKE